MLLYVLCIVYSGNTLAAMRLLNASDAEGVGAKCVAYCLREYIDGLRTQLNDRFIGR